MTTVQNAELLNLIRTRHGESSTYWPVIFYGPEDLKPRFLTFELNQSNSTNIGLSTRFFHSGQLQEYIIDYLSPQRSIQPLTSAEWPDPPGQDIIRAEYASTYDYVISSRNTTYNTIDIDYAWRTRTGEYRGLELSTFWRPMKTLDYARYLVGQFIQKRAAVSNAHQFKILAEVAELQQIQLRLVFVNVRTKESNEIDTSGNVFVIPINHENARRMHTGQFPANSRFIPYRTWLDLL